MTDLNSQSKILIVRFSSIGDIVLTTPVIRCMKTQLKCRIDYLTKNEYKPLLQDSPYIDVVHGFDKDWNEIGEVLKSCNYELIVDLHHNLRSYRLKKYLNKKSIVFDKINIQKWMMVNFKWNLMPDKHIVDRYFESLKKIGITNDGLGLDFFITNEQTSTALNKFPFTETEDYIVFSMVGTYSTKRVPVSLWADILQGIEKLVVLIGGEDIINYASFLENTTKSKLINLTGKISITESAILVKNACTLISGDTGMMHIAAALRTPLVVVWGSTIPGFGMYPYYGDQSSHAINIEVSGLQCRPCSKLGKSRCPLGHFHCMTSISANEVISRINNIGSGTPEPYLC